MYTHIPVVSMHFYKLVAAYVNNLHTQTHTHVSQEELFCIIQPSKENLQ